MSEIDKTQDPLESYGKRKVFSPMSIEQNSAIKRGYFFSPTKAALSMAFLVPIIPLAFYSYSSTDGNWVIFIVAVVVYLFIYSFLLRYIILEERKLKRMVKNLAANKISPTSYFWGIDKIDDEGILHYRYNTGLKKAVIVKVCRGSIVGRETSFTDTYAESNLTFIRGLLRNNFEYTKYSQLETAKVPPGLKDYIKRLEAIDDVAQRAVLRMNLDTISEFSKKHQRVINDYYVIYNRDVRIMKSFKTVVRDLIVSSFNHERYFQGSRILNSEEILEFLASNLNIKTVQRSGYLDNTEKEPFEKYAEVFRLIDSDGQDLLIDFGVDFDDTDEIIPLESRHGQSLESIEKEAERREKRTASKYQDNLFEEDDFVKEQVPDIESQDDEEETVVYVDADGNVIDISELDESEFEFVIEESDTPKDTNDENIDKETNLFDV